MDYTITGIGSYGGQTVDNGELIAKPEHTPRQQLIVRGDQRRQKNYPVKNILPSGRKEFDMKRASICSGGNKEIIRLDERL